MKAKFEATITLGTLLQIVAFLMAAIGVYVRMEVRSSRQDNQINFNAQSIVELKKISEKQVEATQRLSDSVIRIEEKMKGIGYARGSAGN